LIFALCALPLPAASAATVTLAWDKNPEPNLAGYKVHYGTSTGNYDYSVDVGNYTSCTISGLQEGTTYYFAATAYDSNNFESNLSEELAYMIPAGVSGAGAIVNAAKNVIEAEQMSNHTNGTQTGDYWLLWSNGAMSQDVDFPNAGTYSFEITAKGDLANSVGPEMELLIDGQSQGTVFVNTNIPEVYIFEVEVSAGTHEVAIAFNNDYYDTAQGADRNLYVDKIAIVPSPNYLTTDVIEAEQMGYHANGAQTGDYWLLWSNGTMDEDVGFLNTGTYHFEITAKGDLADGVGAEMQLLIDGQSKGIVFVNTNTPEVYLFKVEVSAGIHEVSIAFNNDYYDPAQGVDRNLYVDKIAILSSSGNTTEVIEAEDMSYHANGAQKGEYWLLRSNGTMNEDVEFPATGTYLFEIIAKGDLVNSKGSVFVNTNTSAVFTFKFEVPAGAHDVAIGFNNDYYNKAKSLDRNLYVDKITLSYHLQ
jgi:hypothetical protein